MKFRRYRKVPKRLPECPALVREAKSHYAIWTGKNWAGHVYAGSIRRLWIVQTKLSPEETYETMQGALDAAYDAAVRFEGSPPLEWCTTMPNPTVICWTPDAGQRGWKLHLVTPGRVRVQRLRGYPTLTHLDVSQALCGLRPAHGWGLDMFIEDECNRCVQIATRRGLKLPESLRNPPKIY
jgi:hypothetical protein